MAKKQTALDAPLTPPTRISDESLAYLQRLASQKQQIEIALNAFTSLLAQQYQIGPKDKLDLSGAITREPADG